MAFVNCFHTVPTAGPGAVCTCDITLSVHHWCLLTVSIKRNFWWAAKKCIKFKGYSS